jgi:hypothetical protein
MKIWGRYADMKKRINEDKKRKKRKRIKGRKCVTTKLTRQVTGHLPCRTLVIR